MSGSSSSSGSCAAQAARTVTAPTRASLGRRFNRLGMVEDRVASRRIFRLLDPGRYCSWVGYLSGPRLANPQGPLGLDSGAVMPISDRTVSPPSAGKDPPCPTSCPSVIACASRASASRARPLPDAPMGLLESYRAARRNLLEIIPAARLAPAGDLGRTGPQRWHMLMEPAAIRRVMLEAVEDYPKSVATRPSCNRPSATACSWPKASIGAGNGARRRRRFRRAASKRSPRDDTRCGSGGGAVGMSESGGPPTWSNR
jgi:hypothetical protein